MKFRVAASGVLEIDRGDGRGYVLVECMNATSARRADFTIMCHRDCAGFGEIRETFNALELDLCTKTLYDYDGAMKRDELGVPIEDEPEGKKP